MNDLNILHIEYINKKEINKKITEDKHQKSKVISDTKLEITRIRSRIVEIERVLNNTRKGIGIHVSSDEFTSFKDELEDKNNKLQNSINLLPVHEAELKNLIQENINSSCSERDILHQITTIFADEAVNDLVIMANDKLKELTYTVLAQYGNSFTNRLEEYDDLYKKIGEKLCKQLFTSNTNLTALPTVEQAINERNLLVESLV